MNIEYTYRNFCSQHGIPYERIQSVIAYDDTTLFCPAGMQKYKKTFADVDVSGITVSNIQSCIRLNDISEIGDGTHLGCFNMLGLFSFRDWGLNRTIDFFCAFLAELGILSKTRITIHPDKIKEWSGLYDRWSLPIDTDDQCLWTDGEIGGYCTEFYVDDLEIGNIVNPLGNCIDVGFGLERLDMIVNGTSPQGKSEALIDVISKIIECGVQPSNVKQGYVLRRLLRLLNETGGELDHPFFYAERERQAKSFARYESLKHSNSNRPAEWWWDTHGIRIEEVTKG